MIPRGKLLSEKMLSSEREVQHKRFLSLIGLLEFQNAIRSSDLVLGYQRNGLHLLIPVDMSP